MGMDFTEAHPTKQYFNLGGGGDGWGHGFGGGNDLFAILLLFCLFGNGGWGGGFGNRFYGPGLGMGGPLGADLAATTAESVAETRAGLNYAGQALSAQGAKLDSIVTNQCANTAAIQAAMCNGFSNIGNVVQNGFYNLNTGLLTNRYELSQSIDRCCCQTQQNIAALSANLDKAACAIINSGKDNTQAILSALCNHWQEKSQMKICDLQRQLSEANIINALKNA